MKTPPPPQVGQNETSNRIRLTNLLGSWLLLPLFLASIVLDVFMSPTQLDILIPFGLSLMIIAAFARDFISRLGSYRNLPGELRGNWFDSILMVCVLIFCFERGLIAWYGLTGQQESAVVRNSYRFYSILFYSALVLKTFTGTRRARSFLVSLGRSPSAMTAFTFTLAILLGGLLLCLPQAVNNVDEVSFIDALFISTSATCVTGLATVDISQYFTRFGHVVIMLLVQAGGLGIITMSVLVPILAGRHLEVRAESRLKDILEADTLGDISRNVRLIFLLTFAIEMAGAIILFTNWTGRGVIPGDTFTRLFSAVFHSISSFCNAGLSLFSNNLEGFKSDPVTCLDIAFLIILGGIGFPVLINLREGTRLWLTGKGRLWKLTFNSKVVLSFTAGLLVAGTLLMLFFEWDNTLAGLSLGDKLVNAFFQSVTPRTAGYNTVPIGDLHMISLFGIIILMFIGASPQSTGGGVKTTAFGTIVFTVRALLRNREHVEAFRRTLPPTFIYRAAALVFISMSLCVLSLMCLLITENATFMDMVFEVVSAFGTVGLSTGLTPKLTVAGKLVIIVTMLVGRIGPLTLAVALAARPTAGRFRYPDDHVIIG